MKVAAEPAFERPFPKLGITMQGIQDFINHVGRDKLVGLTTTKYLQLFKSSPRRSSALTATVRRIPRLFDLLIFEVINKKVGFPKLNAMVLKTVRQWAMNDLDGYAQTLAASDLKDKTPLADLYAALGEIAITAGLTNKVVYNWATTARDMQREVRGEEHDKTLRCFYNLAKLDIGYRSSALSAMTARYGKNDFYVFDLKMADGSIPMAFWEAWPTMQITSENAVTAADVIFRMLKRNGSMRQKLSEVPLKNSLVKLREFLSENNIALLRLEIMYFGCTTAIPTDTDYEKLRQCTTRVKETLGHEHEDVKGAFEVARNVTFDHYQTSMFNEYRKKHWNCSVVRMNSISLCSDITLCCCQPCNLTCGRCYWKDLQYCRECSVCCCCVTCCVPLSVFQVCWFCCHPHMYDGFTAEA